MISAIVLQTPMKFKLAILLAALSVAAYVGVSAAGGLVGFPLDDAWIHQTYARNLAETGQLAYVPGQPSAGSTSPLWTLLIAAGYRLGFDYRIWTYALGALSLAGCAWLLAHLSLRLWPDRPRVALAAGLLCVVEWHLVWAAASGMETVLFAALALALMLWVAKPIIAGRDAFIAGTLAGLLCVTRPEGLSLAALAGAVIVGRSMARDGWASALRLGVTGLPGFALPVLPAVALNLSASGTLFPNTFYAKQQEFAIYLSSFSAWLPRALEVIGAPFVGSQVLLLPGFLVAAVSVFRRHERMWARLLPVVWLVAHMAVYAARLPVTYQHGRYLVPIIPVVLLFGLNGSASLVQRIESRLIRQSGIGSVAAVAAAFWVVGAGAYRIDVNVIENELVASARWFATHAASDALIAAHDIGAIGYFARQPLLDLAGLVSPEVIPIIRDEPALLDVMRTRRVDYVALPPGFYSILPDAPNLSPAFEGNSPFAPKHWVVLRAEWP
jgi:hypothetical protein